MLHQLTLARGGHAFVFRYETGQEGALLMELSRMSTCNNPEMPFDVVDASALARVIGRRMADEMKAKLKA